MAHELTMRGSCRAQWSKQCFDGSQEGGGCLIDCDGWFASLLHHAHLSNVACDKLPPPLFNPHPYTRLLDGRRIDGQTMDPRQTWNCRRLAKRATASAAVTFTSLIEVCPVEQSKS
jgi:hypothetical protein